jgi:mannose-6-phosphate isomerase-like protein (cupin superfamily)
MIVQGLARVTLDGEIIDVETGGTIDIPVGGAHRVENPGDEDLIFIEIQRGDYLGEDDITRLQDDYGRVDT